MRGDRVEVLGRTRDWLRVRAPSGEEGWVREDFLRAPLTCPRPRAPGPLPAAGRLR
jgi:SH3-like domain-containing protein